MFTQHQLNKLYQYAYSLCLHESNAFDLLHNALEKFMRMPNKHIQYPQAYMRKIIKSTLIDETRKQQYITDQLYTEDDSNFDIIDTSLRSFEHIIIDQQELQKVWTLLNSNERTLLFLWAVEGFTIDEIAGELDLSRGTLLARLHRLRQKIIKHSDIVDRSAP